MGFMHLKKKNYLFGIYWGICAVLLPGSLYAAKKEVLSEIDVARRDYFALLFEQGLISQPVPVEETLLLLDRADKCEHGRYLLDFGRGQFNFCSGRSVSNDCGANIPRLKVVLRSWMGDEEAIKSQEVFEYLIDALDLMSEGRKDEAIEALTQIKRICKSKRSSH
ncbi:hypothetical protein WDW86_05770 [Bdellovibrionota bacterium FG-2]